MQEFDESWLTLDREKIWHPYTSMKDPLPVYPVVSAEGVRLRLADGQELIDGMSSWWAAIHGYNHPVLNDAAKTQIDEMSHVMFGGLTHRPAVELADELLSIAPPGIDRIFFADSGSVAVEVAIKMAIQYWHAMDRPDKTRLLTIRSGYHGDTFGAMSVCDPITGMHELFTGVLPQHFFVPAPTAAFHESDVTDDIAPVRQVLENHSNEIAAMIIEPVVQGAGGMRIYSPQFVTEARRLCDEFGVLLILDEIATAFGRTGKLFASEHAGISPDIVCVGKALTGGYMTLAATMTTPEVASVISSGEPGVFMHGPTFMANPLACAVALASLRLLQSGSWQARVSAMEAQMKEQLHPCQALPDVVDVRVLGAIGVVQTREPVDVGSVQKAFVKRGVWVRPFGTQVYIMPPYVTTPEDLEHLTRAIFEVLSHG